MAKDSVRLPQSIAGLTSFSDVDTSRIHLSPVQVIAFIVTVIILVFILKIYGPVWLGL